MARLGHVGGQGLIGAGLVLLAVQHVMLLLLHDLVVESVHLPQLVHLLELAVRIVLRVLEACHQVGEHLLHGHEEVLTDVPLHGVVAGHVAVVDAVLQALAWGAFIQGCSTSLGQLLTAAHLPLGLPRTGWVWRLLTPHALRLLLAHLLNRWKLLLAHLRNRLRLLAHLLNRLWLTHLCLWLTHWLNRLRLLLAHLLNGLRLLLAHLLNRLGLLLAYLLNRLRQLLACLLNRLRQLLAHLLSRWLLGYWFTRGRMLLAQLLARLKWLGLWMHCCLNRLRLLLCHLWNRLRLLLTRLKLLLSHLLNQLRWLGHLLNRLGLLLGHLLNRMGHLLNRLAQGRCWRNWRLSRLRLLLILLLRKLLRDRSRQLLWRSRLSSLTCCTLPNLLHLWSRGSH